MRVINVSDTQLSDHDILIQTGPITVMSWNILCQCSGRNNGFKIEEDQASYQKRLERVLDKIEILREAEQPRVITLQECPNPNDASNDWFYQRLTEHYSIKVGEVFSRTKFCNVTVYDPTVFSEVRVEPLSVPTGADYLSPRILVLTGQLHSDGFQQACSIVNFHGDFMQPEVTVEILAHYASQAPVVIAGDLNVSPIIHETAYEALRRIDFLELNRMQLSDDKTVDTIGLSI